MSLIRQNLFDLSNEVTKVFSPLRLLSNADNANAEASYWFPATDIKEEVNQFVIHADLPGVAKENIEVSMENNLLTIQGKRNEEFETKQHGYIRRERLIGTFYRQISLPNTANGEHIGAKLNHGVLEITIPKKEEALPRKIEIIEDAH